jgi:ribonuclease HI
MSHIFDDSPTRGPPTGRRRDILNQKYDHIGVCLDAILSRAEKGMEEIRIAVAEAREAVEQRRHLILRNNVDEDDLDVNVINDQGDYRLVLFTDASSQVQNNGPLFRYGLGVFLGCQNPENRALAAPLTCNSMMEAEILAVWEGFKAVSRLEIKNGGRKVANKIAVYIDNLQGQRLIAAIMKETDGSSLLESLAINHPRIRQYVRSIKEEVSKYTSVTFSWTRSHTTSNSFIALGNKEADKLAKEGLAVALDND